MDARNHQTRAARRETATADLPTDQAPPIEMPPIDQAISALNDVVEASADELHKSRLEALAFAEQPICIIVHGSNEKNAQIVHDVWVNGKGAEVFVNGKWVEFGCIPVGIEVITKRKYVEVLARKKSDSVRTEVIKHADSEQNLVHRETIHGCPFSVIEDRDPRGREWLATIMRERA